MSNGSDLVSSASQFAVTLLKAMVLTRRSNHPILLPYRHDLVLAYSFVVIPSILIRPRHLCKLGIELRRLLMVALDSLLAVRPEAILIKRVDLDGCTDAVAGAEIVA